MEYPATKPPSRITLLLITAIRLFGSTDHEIAWSVSSDDNTGRLTSGLTLGFTAVRRTGNGGGGRFLLFSADVCTGGPDAPPALGTGGTDDGVGRLLGFRTRTGSLAETSGVCLWIFFTAVRAGVTGAAAVTVSGPAGCRT